MSTPTPVAKLWTLQAVCIALLAACSAIVVVYLFCWLSFKEDRPSFGMSNDEAKSAASLYGPVLGMTFTGLRDALNVLLGGLESKNTDWLPFATRGGAILQYVMVSVGFVVAVGALIIVSLHRSPIAPSGLLLIAASIWAATAGDVFHKYLRAYVANRPNTKASR